MKTICHNYAPSSLSDFRLGKRIEAVLAILHKRGYSKEFIDLCDDKLYKRLEMLSTQDKQRCDEFAKKLSDMRCKVLCSELNQHSQTDIVQEIHRLFL